VKAQADQEGLLHGLQALLRDDPSLQIRHDAESGQTILSGMGELQLEVSVEKLRARHGIEVSVGRPEAAYRESPGLTLSAGTSEIMLYAIAGAHLRVSG